MHWILQLGIEAGHAEEVMLDALVELELPHTTINVVPFSHELQPDPGEPEGRVTVYGGTVLRSIAATRSWSPGYYWDDATFRFEAWLANWGEHMLNHDATVARFADVTKVADDIFLRPCTSDKIFTGSCVPWEEFVPWREEVLAGDLDHRYLGLTADTLVSYAPGKNIRQECRFFIAGNQIITASFYRLSAGESFNSVSSRVPFYKTPWYDEEMESFVLNRIAEWQPHKAFVLDIATTAEGYKVIEVNAYNSSGLYECDAKEVILGLEELEAS